MDDFRRLLVGPANSRPAPARTIGEMRGKLLRVECLRCFRVAQITREEALRRFDIGSLWKDVATHLLANGCQHRTRRHEEDGCWPVLSGVL